MINKAVIRECKVLDIVLLCQQLIALWHFEILAWGSTGKNKMWNISKTTDRRAKRPKFGTRDTTVDICRVLFDAQLLQFALGSFCALCKFSDSTIFESLLNIHIQYM